MKVLVLGATGGLGQYMWKGLVKAGHEVVAVVRSPQKLDRSDASIFEKLEVVEGNVLDATVVQKAAQGCTVAINCTSPATGNSTLELAQAAVANASAAGVTQFYMTGGLGALYAPGTNQTILLQDWDDEADQKAFGMPMPGMPKDKLQAMTKGHLTSMEYLKSTGVAHAFVCPGYMVDGPPTDERVVAMDELKTPKALKVNFGNVAQAVIDDVGVGKLLGHRVCVSDSI
mmetsp:Transcript_8392/g.18058  ORF Transcript_8392/g.18058 Transcript_8392/m.18058 type:complete len:229 (-) Transcript_8392:46-732(-)